MIDILGAEEEALAGYMKELGQPRFRASQVFGWLHHSLAADYESMTNLPKELRKRLAAEYPIGELRCVRVLSSKTDETKKFLFELSDGQRVESVLMKHAYGRSACISSQAGCAMGCTFCASTIGGFVRNLTAGEMLGQVYAMQKSLLDPDDRISHIVVMGTGEPLLNLEALLSFIRILSDEKGLHISKRNITVSTCGIVPRIYDLAKEKLPVTLALSLHAPSQKKRRQIMPVAEKYPLLEVIAACRAYFEETGRRISYEYAMIGGFNDSKEDAIELASLVGRGAHINLIPLNAVRERALYASGGEVIRQFAARLEKLGTNPTVRRSMGADIDSACGQLRSGAKDSSIKSGSRPGDGGSA